VTRLLLVSQPTDGGVGRHITDVTLGLADRGYEVTVCSPALPAGLVGRVDHLRLELSRAITPRVDGAAIAKFAKIVGQVRPDAIHAHSSKAGAVARLARLHNPRIPVIYTPHGYSFAGYFSRTAERRIYRGVERLLARASSRVVCVCEAEARLARSVGGGSHVRVVYNGIEPAEDGPVDPGVAELSRKGPVIGALTLLRPGKGLETLVNAVPSLLARHPKAQLAIVGEGPDRDALTARALTLGVAHAVHFLGPSTDPLGVLRGLDIFVHPSWAEAFPYVILEAMSLGRPILATNVGGVDEAIVTGESGVLVAARDEGALATALIDLLDDPTRRAQLGEMALRRLCQRFTRETMISGLGDVYDEVVRTFPGSESRDIPSADSDSSPPATSRPFSR
jgi:glycosyltransferase involved in cell wall biosynthesis